MTGLSHTRSVDSISSAAAGPQRPGWTLALAGMGAFISALDVVVVVGGAVVQGLSWQRIFWINVPVGLAVAALSAARLRESRGTRPQLDITGMIVAAIR